MNEAVNIVFGDSFSYPFCSFDMNIIKIEVPRSEMSTGRYLLFECTILGGIIPPNKIVNDIRMANAFFEGRCISKVVFLQRLSAATDTKSDGEIDHEYDSAKIARDLQMPLCHLFAKRYDNGASS